MDCTLRDGGYYTDWDFDDSVVDAYLAAVEKMPVDYVELGYRNNPSDSYLGRFGYTPLATMEMARKSSKKRLAVMLNEKSTDVDDLKNLLGPARGLVDMVRIAVDPKNFDRAVTLAETVKSMGFELSFNMMYMSRWNGEFRDVLDRLDKLNGVADVICMVDSYGGITSAELREIYADVRERTSCCIGFHGHNNLQLALSNTLTAMECGVDVVDATMLGMGRGAGNLATELLLTYLNTHGGVPVDFNVLGDVVGAFNPLWEKFRWGANLPYMIAGANGIPQKDVMEWVNNRVYSLDSIVRALENRRCGEKDNAKYPLLPEGQKYDEVLIVGGGENASVHRRAVVDFVRGRKNVAMVFATARYAAEYMDLNVPKYYCIVGSEARRLTRNVGAERFDGHCVLPPYPRLMGTEIPEYAERKTFELPKIEFVNEYCDSVTTVALQLASQLTKGPVYVVGYDGYPEGTNNAKDVALAAENYVIFNAFSKYYNKPVVSLTPTMYKGLLVSSIYQYI